MEQRGCEPARHDHTSYQVVAHINRLRRIEGQIRGVQLMVEEGRACLDVVTQLQAISAATDKVADQLVDEHIRGLVTHMVGEPRADDVSELFSVLGRARRR